jgi:hypothetical protein
LTRSSDRYDFVIVCLDSVTRSDKLLERVLRGIIPFAGLRHLLQELGFEERIRGSHHIFTKSGIEEILNLQPQGSHAKPYQVR